MDKYQLISNILHESEKVPINKEDLSNHVGLGMIVHHPTDYNKICLFKHEKYGFWTIPIGKAPNGKSAIKHVHEECWEELGIKVKKIKFIGGFIKKYNRGSGIITKVDGRIFDILSYTGTPKNKEKLKHPIMKWMTLDEISKLGKSKLSNMTNWYLNKVNS
jgi:8-oxo-dGTP pyrophosphatase MutT (NUDIX family)